MRKLACLVAGLLATGSALAQKAVHLKGLNRDLTAPAAALVAPLKTRTPGRSHLIVQFAENPGDDQLNELLNRGAAVLSYVPDQAFSISANDGVSFDGLGVQAVATLRPEEKISPDLAGSLAPGAMVTVVAEFYLDVE